MKQVLQKSIVLILFLIPSFGVIAQKKPDFKQQGFGKSGRDMLKAVIQNKKGEYVLVGSSASWFLSNDDDIFFTKIDANTFTPLINAIPIGDKHTDKANSLVQTRDGGYVIAGYTDSTKLGKREAWLVKVSETGLPLWDTKVSTPQDDEFTAITEAPNGDLWMTGASNDRLWVVKTDAQGKNEKKFTTYSPANVLRSWGNALTWCQNGRYLMIVGTQIMQFPPNEPHLLLVRFDTEGEDFLGETHFAKAEGNGIVRDKSGNFGVIGTSYARDKGDIFFMYATPIWTTIKFFKNLFWDIDETELDVAENRRFIIERVLTRGRMSDWWVLIHLYSFDVIKTEVVQIRYLDKLTLNFCSTFFHLPKTAFRCYNQPQSIQQLWQY